MEIVLEEGLLTSLFLNSVPTTECTARGNDVGTVFIEINRIAEADSRIPAVLFPTATLLSLGLVRSKWRGTWKILTKLEAVDVLCDVCERRGEIC